MEHWSGDTILSTERLTLRCFRAEDVAPYAGLCADPVAMQYLGGVWSPGHTEAVMLAANAGCRSGRGMVAVERCADGAFLGAAGLSFEQWYPELMQVGWRLLSDHRGQGYATEAGRAWIDFAFETLGQSRVIAMADLPNHLSIAVMERLGLRFDHRARLRDGDEEFEAAIYGIDRQDWSFIGH